MINPAPLLVLNAQPEIERHVDQPDMFRRAFQCGHPEELIEVQRDGDGHTIHNSITSEVFELRSPHAGNLPTYRYGRCLNCARMAKARDDKDPNVRPKRTLSAYQAANDREMAVQLHRRVSEAEHRAHRLETQAKAVDCAGKWLAVPARRVWNMPIQPKDVFRLATRQETAFVNDGGATGYHTKTDESTDQRAIDVVEGLAEVSHGHIADGHDESFRLAAVNTISSSGSRIERQKKRVEATMKSNKLSPTVTSSKGALSDHESEARHPRSAAQIRSQDLSYAVLVERLDEGHEAPLDALCNLPLTAHNFERPWPSTQRTSPTPVSPKKGALGFIRRGSSSSTRRSSRIGSLSRNIRNLVVDVHPTRTITETDLDSDSPDWACQTSLAIEAGKISMHSVSKQSQGLMRSKHAAKSTNAPDERRNTYPSGSMLSPRLIRHSESVLLAPRSSAARGSGRLAEMEIALPEKASSKHDSAQVPPASDLNKRLPALPLQETNDEGRE